MEYTVASIILIMLAYWLFGYQPRESDPIAEKKEALEEVVIQSNPDRPVSFGRKNSWVAVKGSDSRRITELLKLQNVEECNWHSGVMAAYAYPNNYVFVTPAVSEWILAVGTNMPQPDVKDKRHDLWHEIMTTLSRECQEAMFFATHRVSSYAAWSRFQEGQLKRLFVYTDGEIQQERGDPFPEEADLLKNLPVMDELMDQFFEAVKRGEKPLQPDQPDEDFVLKLAGQWSINPDLLDEMELEPSCGYVGRLVEEHAAK